MKLLSSWLFSSVNVLSSVIILPLVLTRFSSEEINVWFLFFTIIGLSEIAVLGFNTTFSRFISYTVAGVSYEDFDIINSSELRREFSNKTSQLSDIYTINIFLFTILGILYLIFIYLFGLFSLSKPISILNNPGDGWLAWYILLTANTIRIFLYTYPVFLQGMNKMTLYYNIQTIAKLGYIILGLAVLLYMPSLLTLSLIFAVSIILESILMTINFKRTNKWIKLGALNKKLFLKVWESAWKSGITKIFAPLIQYSSGILFAQFANAALSASYLLTQRLFEMLQGFSAATFSAYMPQIAMLKSKGDYLGLKKIIKKLKLLGFGMLVVGYFLLLCFGDYFLNLMGSKIQLAPSIILILFSISYLFNRIGGFQLDLANQANHVIEHKAIVIYSIVYFGILFFCYDNLSMWVFPLSMIVAQVCTFIFTTSFSYSLYRTNFFEDEKYVTIPIIIALLIINLVYYFMA